MTETETVHGLGRLLLPPSPLPQAAPGGGQQAEGREDGGRFGGNAGTAGGEGAYLARAKEVIVETDVVNKTLEHIHPH